MRKFGDKIKIIVRWISIKIRQLTDFLTVGIWNLDPSATSKRKARLIRDGKVLILMQQTFSSQKIGFQSTALSYRTIMSLVPFLAIAFYVTARVGLSDQLSAFLYANTSDERLIRSLMKAADNILDTAQSGLFGFISMFSFFWIVIWMMLSVRQVFNNVWKVEKERNFLKLIGVVFGILILTPFVILLFSSASIVYTHILDLIFPESDITDSVKSFLGWVIFAAGAIGIISMMYKWIPGTKVYYRHALKAASFSGVIFTVLQFLYLETQVMVTKVSAVYGVLAALPLFMSWMNLSWTIILYGAELTYAFQNVDKHNVSNEQLEDFIEDARRSRKRYDDVSDIVHDVENTKQK